jgi:hypothetical protein
VHIEQDHQKASDAHESGKVTVNPAVVDSGRNTALNPAANPVPGGVIHETDRPGILETQPGVESQGTEGTQMEHGARGAIEQDMQIPPSMQA